MKAETVLCGAIVH